MGKHTITLSDEEEKALLVDMISIQEWVDNAIHNRARQSIDKVILEHSNKQPQKISQAEKLLIVKKAKVITAKEREAKLEE